MTEKEWLECTDPRPMLEFMVGKTSDRKLRLFGCACCRRIWEWINHEQCRKALMVAEQFAEGLVTLEECNSAGDKADLVADTVKEFVDVAASCAVCWTMSTGPHEWNSSQWSLLSAIQYAAYHAALVADFLNEGAADCEPKTQEHTEQSKLMSDIFGNPFRPVTFDPTWLTWNDGSVLRIAQTIHDENAFDRLPILADALTDAGCGHADILNHCRSGGPHVKGCWVVDLLLGKT